MKKLLSFVFLMFGLSAFADTETIKWYVDDDVYTTTTCDSGDDLVLPATPTKSGYNFVGWEIPQYIPLQYIDNKASSNTFDTGFIPNYYSKITATYQLLSTTNQSARLIKDDNDKFYIISFNYSGNYGITTVFNNKSASCAKCVNINQKHTVSVSKDGFYVNGTRKASIAVTSGGASTSLKIFANTSAQYRLYSVQLYQEDVLVHDYAPALDDSGVVCLYDKVTKSFLYNTGSDTVVAGPLMNYE